MSRTYEYRSGLASQISAFIAEKRACGCKYEKEAKTFQTLDRFLVEQGINTPVLPELVVEKWIEKRPNEKRKNQKWRLNFTKRFAKYCQDVEGMRIEKLSIDDLTPELVDHFLQWLRIERNNGTATRSQRLAAIRSFVKYLQIKEPRLLLNFQQILAIPVKRAERKAINPLTKEAIALILRQPDTSTLSGRRDATILCFLYDTAARVQEICDLRIEDVRLDYPASVKILGKGRKTRVVPILPATAQNLKKYLTEMHMLAPEKSHLPLFMNRNGQKLTRAGVTYILNKYAKAASVIDPSIPEKIPPHLMRHTKAMHIYDADNDLVHVRDFLGHSDIKTTDIYARSSLTMKQKALERVSDSPVPSMPSWQKSRSTMEWLKSFGSQKA